MRSRRFLLATFFLIATLASALGAIGFIRAPSIQFARETDFGVRRTSEIGQVALGTMQIAAFTPQEAIRLRATVGGVLFMGMAQPHPSNPVTSLMLRYDPRSQDGQRLQITINGNPVRTPPLFDWFLLPVASYVDSGYNGAVTLYGEPSTPDELAYEGRQTAAGHTVFWADYHPAFRNTFVGYNLFFVDSMLVNARPGAMQNATTIVEPHVPGFSSLPDVRSDQIAASISAAIRRFSSEVASYMFSDYTTTYTFVVENGALSISGDPYYIFFRDTDKDSAAVIDDLTQSLRNYRNLLQLNNRAYAVARTTAQWAAFLRYVKNNYPSAWAAFERDVTGAPPVFSVLTPRTWVQP